MARQDTNDFLAAFGIGAVLGIGAMLLLRPERPNPRKQLQKRLKPHVRKLGKGAARTRKAAGAAAREAGTTTDDVIHAGRELLAEFRGEVERILDEAREELHELAAGQGRAPRHAPAAGAETDA